MNENNFFKKPIVGFYGYWVVLTYLSVVSAVVGIFFALRGNVGYAIICLMISGVCDMFDGPVARLKKRTEREENYGIQIDAFADIISFGALPAVIGLAVSSALLSEDFFSRDNFSFKMIIDLIIASIYVLAALIRLAYFNVVEIELQNRKEKRVFFEGMPVTTVALIIPLVYVICLILEKPLSEVYNIMLVILSVAFVIKIRIPKLRGKQLLFFVLIGIPIAIFIFWNIGKRL